MLFSKPPYFSCTNKRDIAPTKLGIAKVIKACCGAKLVVNKSPMTSGAMIAPTRPIPTVTLSPVVRISCG